jgi:hypothetical protein
MPLHLKAATKARMPTSKTLSSNACDKPSRGHATLPYFGLVPQRAQEDRFAAAGSRCVGLSILEVQNKFRRLKALSEISTLAVAFARLHPVSNTSATADA